MNTRQHAAYGRAQQLRSFLETEGLIILGCGDLENGQEIWIAFTDSLGLDRLYRFKVEDSAPDVLVTLKYAEARCADELATETSNLIWHGADR